MNRSYLKYVFVTFALLLLSTRALLAQEERKLIPVTRTYALTHVNIIQGPGRKIEMGTLIIKNGLIAAVGKTVPIPAEAIVIKADSMYAYAGFIDGLSRVGVVKPKEDSKERVKDPGNPPADRAGITPQSDVRSFLNASEKSIEELRNLGFTTAHVVPYGGMLPGTGSIISLENTTPDGMVMIAQSSFYSELTPAERVYPNTLLGVMAKWRDLYRNAVLQKSYSSLYASNRNGLERPAADRILEAFYPVIEKRTPVLFKAEKLLDIQRILTLQTDLGFSLMIGDVKEGWDYLPKIKSSGAKIFLSLDLPEEKKVEKKDDQKDVKDDKKEVKIAEKEIATDSLEKIALEKRKADFIALCAAQASSFQKAGITFGFASLSAKTKDIHANLRRMIKAGLTEDQALAALTINPAQLLGISDRAGSIDPGKMANIVISDKTFFDEKAKVRYVFVEGVMYKLDTKEIDKSSGEKKPEKP